MLSENLISTFRQAERLDQPQAQMESLSKLRKQVESSSIHQACVRCKKAGHVLIVDDRQNWRIVQVKCDDFRVLPPNPIGFGIGLDYEPSTVYVCDEEAGGGGIGVDPAENPDQRQRGYAEAEREQATAAIERNH